MLVSGPLTDTIGGKVYYNQWWSDGLYDNISGQDTNYATNGANYYPEWMLDWQPTPNLYILYKGGNLQYTYHHGGASFFTPYDDQNQCRSVLGYICAQYLQAQAGMDEPLDTFTVDINSVGREDLDDHLSTNFQVRYDFENFQLKYIGYHNHYDWFQFGSDFDSTSNLQQGTTEEVQQDQRITTHEVTLSSTTGVDLSWIA